jgi:outer membrane protein TolC
MRRTVRSLAALLLCAPLSCKAPLGQVIDAGWRHEVRAIEARDPLSLPPAPIPPVPPPVTVADEAVALEPYNLSLNEAVRITLENAKVVRVFGGLAASNSGRTIYDAAIATTAIDQAQARFDPALTAEQSYSRSETPGLRASQFLGADLVGPRVDVYRAAAGLSKLNTTGGSVALNIFNNRTRQASSSNPGGLNPADTSGLELNYTQPLLQGGGFQFNVSPIVLARIDTERSYFQFKDATQELIRGTIEAYWNLVFARLSVWSTTIQVEQATEALKLEQARQVVGIANARNVAQATVTLNQFKAALIAAKADVLAREGALRNVLMLPVTDGRQIVPVSAPASLRLKPEWDKLLRFAEQRRPDIIELKLVLEADAQRKIQAENFALPRLDAVGTYRWNGLSGRLPVTRERIASDFGQFTDWSVGINFSVPLGLREGRARIREQDLIILRDRANLEQQLHFAANDLAITVRSLESTYEQYLAFRATRAAALSNLLIQIEEQRVGRNIYLNVLQALNDWGNSVQSEARALVDYNILLATLERQTGTILETHGLVFVEERFTAAGPLIRHEPVRDYPQALKPIGEPTQYPTSGGPGENAFDLTKPDVRPPGKKKDGPKIQFAEDADK